MPVQKHTHKYFKAADGTYHCALDDCSHYMPTNIVQGGKGMIGRKSICFSCGQVFVLALINLKVVEPKCPDCDIQNGISVTDWANAIDLIEQENKTKDPIERIRELNSK